MVNFISIIAIIFSYILAAVIGGICIIGLAGGFIIAIVPVLFDPEEDKDLIELYNCFYNDGGEAIEHLKHVPCFRMGCYIGKYFADNGLNR